MQDDLHNSSHSVTMIFRNPSDAEAVYNKLLQTGYNNDDFNLLMTDKTHDLHFKNVENTSENHGSKALEGLGVGGAVGGTVGAIAAAIAAVGTSLVIPGLGLLVTGPLAASLAGAGAGGVLGGILGSLVGAGISEDVAAQYEVTLKNGGVVIMLNAKPDEDLQNINTLCKSFNGEYLLTS